MTTPVKRALGLGAAHEGVAHWWAQRVSAVALVPLALWLATSLIALAGADHATVTLWLSQPLAAVLLLLTILATFYHAALGMQVIYEDYISTPWARLAADLATRFAAALLGALAAFSVLKIALAGQG
jgi:succinate dehydrogenase / fumarate reductase membrane anchor subunit